jgi:hypothetical protein
MGNFVEDKSNSMTKVKAQMKEEMMEYIIECLIEKYGIENCSYVRNGNGESKTKEFAVRTSTIDVAGETFEGVVCINATAKDYRERVTAKGQVHEPYNFNIAREEYNIYVEEKTTKKEKADADKKKKIAKDKEQREKKVNFEDF